MLLAIQKKNILQIVGTVQAVPKWEIYLSGKAGPFPKCFPLFKMVVSAFVSG
jgi:hypothetical protein